MSLEIRNPEFETEYIKLIASGLTIKRAALSMGTTELAICAWMQDVPAFSEKVVLARANSQTVLLDQCRDIMAEEEDVNRARLQVDFQKWQASKLQSHVYGDRLAIDVTNRVDLSNVLSAAEQRAAIGRRHDVGNVIDAEIVETQQLTHESASASIAGDTESPNDSNTPKELDPLGILE